MAGKGVGSKSCVPACVGAYLARASLSLTHTNTHTHTHTHMNMAGKPVGKAAKFACVRANAVIDAPLDQVPPPCTQTD